MNAQVSTVKEFSIVKEFGFKNRYVVTILTKDSASSCTFPSKEEAEKFVKEQLQ